MSEHGERGGDDSFLETMEEHIPVRVRDRPNISNPTSFTPIVEGGSQRRGSGNRQPSVQVVVLDKGKTDHTSPKSRGTSHASDS